MKCDHVYLTVTSAISECCICGNRKVNKKKIKEQKNVKARTDS